MTNIEWDATFLKVVETSALSAEEDNALEKNPEKAKKIISDLVKGAKNVAGFVRSDESGINLVVEAAIKKEEVTLKAIEDAHEMVQRISGELCNHAKAWSDARIEEVPPANVAKIAEPAVEADAEAEQESEDDCEEGFFIATFVPTGLIDHIIGSILSASFDEEEDLTMEKKTSPTKSKVHNQVHNPRPKSLRTDAKGNDRKRLFLKDGGTTMPITSDLTKEGCKAFIESINDNLVKMGAKPLPLTRFLITRLYMSRFVTKKQALALRELGFNYKGPYYIIDATAEENSNIVPMRSLKAKKVLFIPTVDEAIDWIRRKFDIIIYNGAEPYVNPTTHNIMFGYSVKKYYPKWGWNYRVYIVKTPKWFKNHYAAKRWAIEKTLLYLKEEKHVKARGNNNTR